MEYVTCAFATSSVSPREYSSTSTTASRLPSFNIRVRAIKSVSCGLRKKSMCRLVVTAKHDRTDLGHDRDPGRRIGE